MKLLLIGITIEDYINCRNKITHKPGGLFYSALAISKLRGEEDELYLASVVSNDSYYLFENVYKEYNQSCLEWRESVPKVHLTIFDDKERREKYENLNEKIALNAIKDFNAFDGIYINMTTGFDISLEDLKEIRSMYNGVIYLDYHTLARGVDSNLKREFRVLENFSEWAKNVDIMQANEYETKTFYSDKSEIEIANECLKNGVRALIVTKGAEGASLYYLNNKLFDKIEERARKIIAINSVGCGDIFGATFFYYYITTKNFKKALKAAVTAGSFAATCESFEDYNQLKENVELKFN